jgi:hypothetical protein
MGRVIDVFNRYGSSAKTVHEICGFQGREGRHIQRLATWPESYT